MFHLKIQRVVSRVRIGLQIEPNRLDAAFRRARQFIRVNSVYEHEKLARGRVRELVDLDRVELTTQARLQVVLLDKRNIRFERLKSRISENQLGFTNPSPNVRVLGSIICF